MYLESATVHQYPTGNRYMSEMCRVCVHRKVCAILAFKKEIVKCNDFMKQPGLYKEKDQIPEEYERIMEE